MEVNVQEAVRNNIFALMDLMEVADETGCETFVLISSDKAVNPTSVMGCTKRVGELILAAWPSDTMRCVSVRFGNVLGSSGSVIPLFQEQLSKGKPITITHPNIRRFFMTIEEAVALVLQASVIAKRGDILVLDMGSPIRIVDLAHTLVKMSGKSLEEVEFKFTGLRKGEKLNEELYYPEEGFYPTACPKVKRTMTNKWHWSELQLLLAELRDSTVIDGADPIRRALANIVPQCQFDIPAESQGPQRVRATAASLGAEIVAD
jgi:FlaA1/EpsC-like NDP-sugar epimerase